MKAARKIIFGFLLLTLATVVTIVVVADFIPAWKENRRLDRIASALNSSSEFHSHFSGKGTVSRLGSGVQGAAVFQSGDYKDSDFRVDLPSGEQIDFTIKWIFDRHTGDISVTGFYKEDSSNMTPLSIEIRAEQAGDRKPNPAAS